MNPKQEVLNRENKQVRTNLVFKTNQAVQTFIRLRKQQPEYTDKKYFLGWPDKRGLKELFSNPEPPDEAMWTRACLAFYADKSQYTGTPRHKLKVLCDNFGRYAEVKAAANQNNMLAGMGGL